jgi:glycosyltransferase involved in cell wall biosynthesis
MISTPQKDEIAAKRIGIVTYIEPKVASELTIRCLDNINRLPVIKHLFERLQRGMQGECFQYCIVHHNDAISERLNEIFHGTGIELFKSDGPAILAVLREFCEKHPQFETILIFPEQSIFPDCVLTQKMLAVHLDRKSDVTVAPEYPFGLLPQIIQTAAVLRLDQLKIPAHTYPELLSILQLYNPTQNEKNEWPIKVTRFNSLLSPEPILERLPFKLVIDNKHARAAAERVMDRLSLNPGHGPEAAYLFKEEIGAIERRAEREASISAHASSVYLTSATRILFSNPHKYFTGGEESLFLLISNLDRKKYQPVAVFHEQTVLAQRLAALGIPVEIADYNYTEINPHNLLYCNRLLSAYNVDLVHMDGLPAESLMVEAYYRHIPIIGHLRFLVGPTTPTLGNLCTKIIAISDAVAANLGRSQVDPQKIIRIYNGVDLKSFDPSAFDKLSLRKAAGLSPDSFIISMVARITPQKRQEILIRALPKIVDNINAFVIFVGEIYSGNTCYMRELHELIAQLNLERHVSFWGFEKDIASIYAMSDALALCTLKEPFGRCIIEALAMGLPVIVPNSAGPAEIVRHHHDGILYDAANSEALADAITHLCSDQNLHSKIIANARIRASLFDVTLHVEQVQRLYEDILSPH